MATGVRDIVASARRSPAASLKRGIALLLYSVRGSPRQDTYGQRARTRGAGGLARATTDVGAVPTIGLDRWPARATVPAWRDNFRVPDDRGATPRRGLAGRE